MYKSQPANTASKSDEILNLLNMLYNDVNIQDYIGSVMDCWNGYGKLMKWYVQGTYRVGY
jgi:hypothetical protein